MTTRREPITTLPLVTLVCALGLIAVAMIKGCL